MMVCLQQPFELSNVTPRLLFALCDICRAAATEHIHHLSTHCITRNKQLTLSRARACCLDVAI